MNVVKKAKAKHFGRTLRSGQRAIKRMVKPFNCSNAHAQNSAEDCILPEYGPMAAGVVPITSITAQRICAISIDSTRASALHPLSVTTSQLEGDDFAECLHAPGSKRSQNWITAWISRNKTMT